MAALTPEEIGQIIEQFLHTVGTRQYIGARYVPIFGRKGEDSIEWDNTAPYEPLTIVLYQGDSYTSRQYVPTGIEITNQDFWAQTGNYNAQIQAYIAQVQQYDGRITQNADDILTINGELDEIGEAIDALEEDLTSDIINSLGDLTIKQFNGYFTATICYNDTAAICFDCAGFDNNGGSGDGALLDSWLGAILGERKLDAFVITHFHNDHARFPSAVAAHCDEDTDIFIQMAVTTADVGSAEYQEYQDNLNLLLTACSQYGLKAPAVPVDGSTHEYGNITMTIWNTDENNRASYRASRANSGYNSTRLQSLNNYSLICRCQCGSSSYVETGDVEGAAQKAYATRMNPCTIARNPHHLFNRIGYEMFFDRLQPKMWLVSDHWNGTIGDIDLNEFRYSYIYRYLLFNQDVTNIITNIDTDVSIELLQNAIINASGFLLDKDHDSNGSIGYHHIAAMLPPQLYGLPTDEEPDGDGDPYWLEKLEITDIWKLKLAMVQYPQFQFMCGTMTSSPYIASFPFRKQCDLLFRPYNAETSNVFVLFNDLPEITLHGANLAANRIELYAQVGTAPKITGEHETYTIDGIETWRYADGTTWEGLQYLRRFDDGAIRAGEFDGGMAVGDWTTGSQTPISGALRNASIIGAALENGFKIPLTRAVAVGQIPYTRATPESEWVGGAPYNVNLTWFRGCAVSTNHQYIYDIVVNTQGIITSAKQIEISSGTATDVHIIQFVRIM